MYNKKPFKGLFGSNLRRVCKNLMMTKISDFSEQGLVFKEKPKSKRFQDLVGQKFNRLTVMGFMGTNKQGNSFWHCKCDCGNIKKVPACKLKNGDTKSCGCLSAQKVGERSTTHGHYVNGKASHTYTTWRNMKDRCYNMNSINYSYYGGRGITVCEYWHKFENFLEDMGVKPIGMTIERINNNKGYCKENCRYATPKEQGSNKRNNVFLTFNGKTQTVAQWTEETGIKRDTISDRLERGWPIEVALTKRV